MDEIKLTQNKSQTNDKFSLEKLLEIAETQEKIEIKDLFKKRNFLQKLTGNFLYDNDKMYILPTIEKCPDVQIIAFHWLFWSFLIDYEKK